MTQTRFPAEALRAYAAELAERAGVPAADAALLAEALVDADLQGTHTHGLTHLPIYLRRVLDGVTNPHAEPVFEQVREGVLRVDAGHGIGHVQGIKTLQALVPLARRCGIAAAGIRNGQHLGALSFYCNKALEQELVLLAFSNSVPALPPTGGASPIFGTNPLAVSFPSGKGFPVKIDLSPAIATLGQVAQAARAGEQLPPEWGLDAEGKATTDPRAILAGSILPIAGHKGYALALLAELFSGVLSGNVPSPLVGSLYGDRDRPQETGHFFILLDIAAFMPMEELRRRVDDLIDRIRSSRPADGAAEILVPGERSHRNRLRNLADGIPVADGTLQQLAKLAAELGVPPLR